MSEAKKTPKTYDIFVCPCGYGPCGTFHLDWNEKAHGDWMKSEEVWPIIAQLQADRDALLALLTETKGWMTQPHSFFPGSAQEQCQDVHDRIDAAIKQAESH